jgi:hypothetical protein
MVGKIVTGEIEGHEGNVAAITRGEKGGLARASKLTPVQRPEIAKIAAQVGGRSPRPRR